MEFGKKVYIGNYILTKKGKTLSKDEMTSLRNEEGIAQDKRKELPRHSLPYMHIEAVGGGWELNIYTGMTMFDALDELTVAEDEERGWTVPGTEGQNAEALITGMFIDTTIVGDVEYQTEKMAAMCRYIKRRVNGGEAEEIKDEKK